MTTRRGFIKGAAAVAVAAAIGPRAWGEEAAMRRPLGISFGMLPAKNVEETVAAIKAAGFDGIEVNAPSEMNKEELKAASEKHKLVIHGVCDSVHWKDRLSDADEAVRTRGVEGLKAAIADAAFYGATTVLLVPGKVTGEKETFEQCWSRSQAEIRKALPAAEEAKVKIAVEVVWNDFLTKPDQMVKYLDEIGSPYVGAYLDVSNVIRYGVMPAEWVKVLGKRLLKVHFKGYSNEKKWVKIGEGDEDYPAVMKALDEVGYKGWLTAEIGFKSEADLKDVYERMKKAAGQG